MEVREGDVIISVDKVLTEGEQAFVKGQANFLMGVLANKQYGKASMLMINVVRELMKGG